MSDVYAMVREALGRRQRVHATYGGHRRCLPLDGLTDVSVHDGPWHTRTHSEPQHCVEEVDLEVE